MKRLEGLTLLVIAFLSAFMFSCGASTTQSTARDEGFGREFGGGSGTYETDSSPSLYWHVEENSGEADKTKFAEELVKRAPRISLEEENISSFQVDIEISVPLPMLITLSENEAGQRAFGMFNPHDGTPIFFSNHASFMFYDPASAEIVLGKGGGLHLTLSCENPDRPNPFSFGIAGAVGVERQEEKAQTLIDIRSLFAPLERPLEVSEKEPGLFVVKGKTKYGHTLKAHVEPAREGGAYTMVELGKAGNPLFKLNNIVLDQDIPHERFDFPEEKLLDSGLSIRRIEPTEDFGKATLGAEELSLAFATRLALASGVPEMKADVERYARRRLDWEKLKEIDREVVPALRSLFEND